MKGFLSEGPRTANGLREGDVEIIMARRVAVWAAKKARQRLVKIARVRRGPVRRWAA
jgi:hypothetical protein